MSEPRVTATEVLNYQRKVEAENEESLRKIKEERDSLPENERLAYDIKLCMHLANRSRMLS